MKLSELKWENFTATWDKAELTEMPAETDGCWVIFRCKRSTEFTEKGNYYLAKWGFILSHTKNLTPLAAQALILDLVQRGQIPERLPAQVIKETIND